MVDIEQESRIRDNFIAIMQDVRLIMWVFYSPLLENEANMVCFAAPDKTRWFCTPTSHFDFAWWVKVVSHIVSIDHSFDFVLTTA
jgi:hypothetical protein